MALDLDTIYALSSGGLPSGVAVIRVSGQYVKDVARQLCGELPQPRFATLKPICDSDGALLDEGLVLYFPGPNSFTGEDCLELQVHGSRAVVSAILDTLSKVDGCRQAEAGEFSRRAFENGKLDLVEIEGLGELIHAETEAQRKLALRFAGGGVSRQYEKWMEQLSFGRAMLEAELDFADEGDIPGSVSDQIWPQLEVLVQEMKSSLAGERANEIIRDGFRVVIAGPPNSGKSSLLNYLAKRDVAIVTDIAGTTRDVISVDLDLGGLKICLVDTAGIRETTDVVERAGIERTGQEVEGADLVLLLRAADEGEMDSKFDGNQNFLDIRTKADLAAHLSEPREGLYISTKTGDGIDSLLKQILTIAERSSHAGESSVVLNARHRNYIESSISYVEKALSERSSGIEISADCLRSAAEQIGRIVGFVNADELLGVIFSRFCVGK